MKKWLLSPVPAWMHEQGIPINLFSSDFIVIQQKGPVNNLLTLGLQSLYVLLFLKCRPQGKIHLNTGKATDTWRISSHPSSKINFIHL
jgi:hypothetical protein